MMHAWNHGGDIITGRACNDPSDHVMVMTTRWGDDEYVKHAVLSENVMVMTNMAR